MFLIGDFCSGKCAGMSTYIFRAWLTERNGFNQYTLGGGTFKETRNRFQGINLASPCSWYGNPNPTLIPILDCSKIPALMSLLQYTYKYAK